MRTGDRGKCRRHKFLNFYLSPNKFRLAFFNHLHHIFFRPSIFSFVHFLKKKHLFHSIYENLPILENVVMSYFLKLLTLYYIIIFHGDPTTPKIFPTPKSWGRDTSNLP